MLQIQSDRKPLFPSKTPGAERLSIHIHIYRVGAALHSVGTCTVYSLVSVVSAPHSPQPKSSKVIQSLLPVCLSLVGILAHTMHIHYMP